MDFYDEFQKIKELAIKYCKLAHQIDASEFSGIDIERDKIQVSFYYNEQHESFLTTYEIEIAPLLIEGSLKNIIQELSKKLQEREVRRKLYEELKEEFEN